MTKVISTVSCTAFVVAVAISAMAQAPAAPQPNSAPPTDHRITVTGCLRPAPAINTDGGGSSDVPSTAGTTGTTGATGVASDPATAKFVLADATISPAASEAGSSSATAPGANATTTTREPVQTYQLIANPVALSPHVGKKLELTGTLDESAAAASSPKGQLAGPVLRVEAGKVLAAACQN